MDLASVVAALASVGARVSGSAPNSSVRVDSSRACPPNLAGPEPSGTIHDLGQHFQMNASHGCPRIMRAGHPNGTLRKRIGSSERCKLWVPSPEETVESSSRSMEWRRKCTPG